MDGMKIAGNTVIWVIFGMGAVTYLPRMLPLVFFSRLQLPPRVSGVLRLIPAAVLSALVIPSLLVTEGELNLTLANHNLLAAFPTFLMAIKTRNLLLTVATGIFAVILLGRLFP